jgi:hypothetical protein
MTSMLSPANLKLIVNTRYPDAGMGESRHPAGAVAFVVKYVRAHTALSQDGAFEEKRFTRREGALTFCVIQRNFGSLIVEIAEYIEDNSDAVLDGAELDRAIDRHRAVMEARADPPWL